MPIRKTTKSPSILAVTRLLTGRFIADNVTVVQLAHAFFVDEDVGVADHLGEGEEGLGDGDVAPDRLGQLVAGARALGDQAVDLLLAAVVRGEAAVGPRGGGGGRPPPGREGG